MVDLDTTFSALGNSTRRAILARLALGELSLSDLAEPLKMSQTGVTKHISVLENAGLVSVNKRGRTRYCALQAEPMQAASVWLDDYKEFWDACLGNLAQHLGETE